MKILLDHCVDIRFANYISTHTVANTRTMGWEELSNGRLLSAAEDAGFEILVTVDKNLRHQQNFSGRKIALVTLNPRLVDIDHISPMASELQRQIEDGIEPGSTTVIGP